MSSPSSQEARSPHRAWRLQFTVRGVILAVAVFAVIFALLPHCRMLVLIWALKRDNSFIHSFIHPNWAAENLASSGRDGIAALVKALQDPDESVRLSAAFGLTEINPEAAKLHPELIPALVNALNDRHAGVRNHAAWALGRLGTEAEPAVPTLVRAMQDIDVVVQHRAEEALERIRTGYRPTP